MKTLNNFLLLCFTLLTSLSWAQDSGMNKHPKVIEVEMMLTKEATNFLQQRIPAGPVYVNIEIEPLRRSASIKDEKLPYFYSEDEVGDEWDVIDTPMVLLLSRIKKADIKVEVPSSITDLELVDLKEKLYQHLKLIPGRDRISIERKSFVIKTNDEAKDYSLYYFIGVMSVIMFTGLFVLLRFGNKSRESASSNSSTATTTNSSNQQAPVKQHAPLQRNHTAGSGVVNSKVNGDITFNDSIKAADMLKEKLHTVVNSSVFPLLSDMLILEKLADKSLSSFGAFVFEMPRKHQQKIFFRGRSDLWFKGYVEASSLDMDCFISVEKMLRNRIPSGSEKWEELLIQVWRLGDDAHHFLKQIPQEDAFSILAQLPKTIAVPTAKKTFPGGWARILEIKEYESIKDEIKLEAYLEKSLLMKQYSSFKSIDEYKKDLELIDYLRMASVKDEEDIYESLDSNSQIHSIRPPFYLALRAEGEDFKSILAEFELSEWALAIINSPRNHIKKIMSELDDKRRYLLSTYLKQLDESQISIMEQVELREQIGKKFQQMIILKNLEKDISINETKEEEGNENNSHAA